MSDRAFSNDGKASPIWLYSFYINMKQNYKKKYLKDYVEKNNQVNKYLNKKDQKYNENNF